MLRNTIRTAVVGGLLATSGAVSLLAAAPASAQAPAFDGYLDETEITATSTRVAGWACVPGNPGQTLRIDVYNGPAGQGRPLGSIPAGNVREQAVGDRCGGNSAHGFDGTVASVCAAAGQPTGVDLYVYAVASDDPPINAYFRQGGFTFGC